MSYSARPWLRHYDYWVPHHMSYPRRPLHEILDTAAVDVPDRPATSFFGATLTLRGAQAPGRSAGRRRSARCGLVKGDRVGIMLPNCPQYIIAAFAILRHGAIVVNINPTYTAARGAERRQRFGHAVPGHARRAGAAGARHPRATAASSRSSSRRSRNTRPPRRRRRAVDGTLRSVGPPRRRAAEPRHVPRADRRRRPRRPAVHRRHDRHAERRDAHPRATSSPTSSRPRRSCTARASAAPRAT